MDQDNAVSAVIDCTSDNNKDDIHQRRRDHSIKRFHEQEGKYKQPPQEGGQPAAGEQAVDRRGPRHYRG